MKKKTRHSSCYYYDCIKTFLRCLLLFMLQHQPLSKQSNIFFTEHSAVKIPQFATATGYVLHMDASQWKVGKSHVQHLVDILSGVRTSFLSPAIYLFSASSSGSFHGAKRLCKSNCSSGVSLMAVNTPRVTSNLFVLIKVKNVVNNCCHIRKIFTNSWQGLTGAETVEYLTSEQRVGESNPARS